MRFDVVTHTETKFPWKLTSDSFEANFATLEDAEKEGRCRKRNFTIERTIETRDYFLIGAAK